MNSYWTRAQGRIDESLLGDVIKPIVRGLEDEDGMIYAPRLLEALHSILCDYTRELGELREMAAQIEQAAAKRTI